MSDYPTPANLAGVPSGHPYAIEHIDLGEHDYRQTSGGANWEDINETRPPSAEQAREAFRPPASQLGETYRPHDTPRAPDRNINDQQSWRGPIGYSEHGV